MYRRPNLYSSYEKESHIFPTVTQKVIVGLFLLILVLMPFDLPIISQIPGIRFLGDSRWLRISSSVLVFVIGALGLNILSGVAGQVSLGHAFFMGAGACTGAYLGGEANSQVWGLGLPIWIWLPAAAIVPAVIGALIAPVAVRLRGLYLAIVTLGLVFVGIHLGTMGFGRRIAGPQQLGRGMPELDIRLWKEETPLLSVSGDDSTWFGLDITDNMKTYWFMLVLAVAAVVLAKNLVRSRTGRALQAIRDRDVAAEVMGVPEQKYKVIAFAISSAYAGVAGAMLAALSGTVLSDSFNLFLSVEFVAIVLIGGAGSTAGTVIGAAFVVLIPRFLEEFTKWLEDVEGGLFGLLSNVMLTSGEGDFGFISTGIQTQGWPLSIFDWNVILFGFLIVVFLIFEPLGLFGIWVKIRNYWKGWPFSY